MNFIVMQLMFTNMTFYVVNSIYSQVCFSILQNLNVITLLNLSISCHYLKQHQFQLIKTFSFGILILMLNAFQQGFIYFLKFVVVLNVFLIIDFFSYVMELKKFEQAYLLLKKEFIFQIFLQFHFKLNFRILLIISKFFVEDYFIREEIFLYIHPYFDQSKLFFI